MGALEAAKRELGQDDQRTIECFWSIFKRGIVGSLHKISAKQMPLYVAELHFRYSNRFNSDISEVAICGC
jgi:ISXO2-like transposase domain